MPGSLDQPIRQLAPEGLQIHIWPTRDGFQANVKERASDGWTCVTLSDPIDALGQALRQRLARSGDRAVVVNPEPQQIDIEEAIAVAHLPPVPELTPVSGDFEDLLG